MKLTPRQAEVGRLAAQALPDKEIASRMGIDVATVKGHLKSIYHTLRIPRTANRRVAMVNILRAGE